MRKYLVLVTVCISSIISYSQNVGIGTPNPQNKLHVAGGFRLDTLTGVNGAGLLRHDANGVVYGIKFSGNVTDVLRGDGTFGSGGAGSVGWLLTGNSGTNPVTNFIGTTDDKPLSFRLNNIPAGQLNQLTNNYGIGLGSMFSITTGTQNVGFGRWALLSNTTGSYNTSIGHDALSRNTTGTSNTAVGNWGLLLNTTGQRNTAVGDNALSRNTVGNDNTAVGYFALLQNVGEIGMLGFEYGFKNTAVGSFALSANTRGIDNTATGYNALALNTIGSQNAAFGSNALKNNQSSSNSAFGGGSLLSNTTGGSNSALGTNSLRFNTTGDFNTAIGYHSLFSNTDNENTAVGAYSLASNTTGSSNTAVGYKALAQNTVSGANTAMGESALEKNTGPFNSAFGLRALWDNNSGSYNSALGYEALGRNTTGIFNTAMGVAALDQNLTGDHNIAIGSFSGTTSSFNNTVSIGNDGWLNGFSNQVFIGNASTIWIGGWKPWSVFSDARLKSDIKEDVHGLDFIMRLRPVSYNQTVEQMTNTTGNKSTKDFPGKYDADKIRMSGFMAQEVEQAAKEVNYHFTGISKVKSVNEVYSMSYESFVIPLVKAVQEQQAIIEKQQKQIDDLLKRIIAWEKK